MPNLLNETSGLIAFVRTVEAGSFSAAARNLDTTPSAVSKSVARLEKKIGARLFLRSTRALTLTQDGRIFFEGEIRHRQVTDNPLPVGPDEVIVYSVDTPFSGDFDPTDPARSRPRTGRGRTEHADRAQPAAPPRSLAAC